MQHSVDEDRVQSSRALEFPYEAAIVSFRKDYRYEYHRSMYRLECHALRVLSRVPKVDSKGIGNVPCITFQRLRHSLER